MRVEVEPSDAGAGGVVDRWPLLSFGVLVLAYFAHQALAGSLLAVLGPLDGPGWIGGEVARWTFPIAAFALLGWWWQAGIWRRTEWRRLAAPGVPTAAALLAFHGAGPLDPTALAWSVAFGMVISVFEEALFRGLVLRALLSLGTWPAVLVSSGLFGLWHVGAGQPENWVVVCLAAMFGVGLAAMRLGCGTIWPGVVWHWAYNLLLHVGPDGAAGAPILFGSEPAAQAFGRLAPALLMLAYGLVALRPRRFGPGALAGAGAMGRRAAVRER